MCEKHPVRWTDQIRPLIHKARRIDQEVIAGIDADTHTLLVAFIRKKGYHNPQHHEKTSPVYLELVTDALPPRLKQKAEEAGKLYWRVVEIADRWVRKQAKIRGETLGIDFDDAYHAALIGTYRAARRFDPDRDIKFGTYAKHWARVMMDRARTDDLDVTMNCGRAAIGGMSQAAVRLDDPLGEKGDLRLLDTLISSTPSPEDSIILDNFTDKLLEARPLFSDREWDLLMNHAEGKPEGGETLAVIGARWGISRERARQIINTCFSALKEYFMPSAQIQEENGLTIHDFPLNTAAKNSICHIRGCNKNKRALEVCPGHYASLKRANLLGEHEARLNGHPIPQQPIGRVLILESKLLEMQEELTQLSTLLGCADTSDARREAIQAVVLRATQGNDFRLHVQEALEMETSDPQIMLDKLNWIVKRNKKLAQLLAE